MTIYYEKVYPNDIVETKTFDKIKEDIQTGITNKVSASNPIFNNYISVSTLFAGNVYNVSNGILNNDAINVRQNNTGNYQGIGIGNVILFHGEQIPKGYAICDGTIPKECPLQITTPKLDTIEDVKYIIRIE